MDKKPIHKFQIFCAYCNKDMGIVNSIPICMGYVDGIRHRRQKYEYIIVKDRKEGYTFFGTKTFCSKICKDKYCKKKKFI